MRALLSDIEAIPTLTRFGRVARIEGLAVEITGAQGAVSLGGQCRITIGNNKKISCEVVGFRDGRALVMPLGALDGISLGARADFEDRPACIYPSQAWLGRVIDGFAQPMDGKGPLRLSHSRRIDGKGVLPMARENIREPISTSIRCIDGLHICYHCWTIVEQHDAICQRLDREEYADARLGVEAA